MKIIIIAIIIAILVSLGVALIATIKGGDSHSSTMFNSLKIRVTLSLLLFIFLIFASFMDWIQPHDPMINKI